MLKPTLAELNALTASGIALVDFDVPWCASCRIQERIIHSLARRFCGHAAVVSVDVDKIRKIAVELDIQNVPTLILFKEGKEIHRFVGLHSEEVLSRAIEKAMGI
jgi:thioredoxin 1